MVEPQNSNLSNVHMKLKADIIAGAILHMKRDYKQLHQSKSHLDFEIGTISF